MRIHFLGTSDGYPEKERYCSCTVVTVKGKLYVIDAGLALYSALLHNDYQPRDVAGVFITHMHGDHASGLVEFTDLMAWGNRQKLEAGIFVPSIEGKTALLAYTYAMDCSREVKVDVYSEGEVFNDGNVKVSAFRTQHGKVCYGFLLEAEGKKVYFTGDMRGDLTDMPAFVYEDRTNLIICESAHNRLPEHADKFNNMKTDRIIINHIASGHSEREFNECKPMVNKPFDLAYDSMSIEI